MINRNKKNSGVTLIEIVLYLGLFVLLILGNLTSVYNVIESTNRSQSKAFMYEEGNFLLTKIDWALSGIQVVNVPVSGSSGSILSVNKWDSAIGTVEIKLIGNDMVLTKGSNTNILNNQNVIVSNLVFNHQNDGNIESVSAQFMLTSQAGNGSTISSQFETTKYLRK